MPFFVALNIETFILNRIKQKRSGNAFVFNNQLVMCDIQQVEINRLRQVIRDLEDNENQKISDIISYVQKLEKLQRGHEQFTLTPSEIFEKIIKECKSKL
jgi:hypothetical protein